MRIFGVVEYLGTRYKGWQKQPHDLSVQEEMEKVLSQILNSPINIYGSGRTDAGVHALGQTFHFDINKEVDIAKLRYSSNLLLANDIHIKELKEVDDDFHARFSAKEKVYQYYLYLGEKDPFLEGRMTHYPYPFSFDIFKDALNLFKGEHNYQDFTSKEEDEDNFIRTISSINIEQDNKNIKVTIRGNGFMRYMIRDIIGTSLAISSSKEDIQYIKDHLDSKNRNIVSYKAPSEGLYLLEVVY